MTLHYATKRLIDKLQRRDVNIRRIFFSLSHYVYFVSILQAPDRSLFDNEVPDDIIQRIWANYIIQNLRQERALQLQSREYTTPVDDEIRAMSIQYR